MFRKSTIIRHLATLLVVVPLLAWNAAAAADEPIVPKWLKSHPDALRAVAATDASELDSVIAYTVGAYHIPGLSACIVKNGQVVWTGDYGEADTQLGIPVADSTVFMLASISKTFVAMALMQMWEQGALDLDEDVSAYIPFGVVNPYHPGTPITTRMILAHTSSIAYNFNAWLPLITWGGDSPIVLREFLEDYLVPGGSMYQPVNYRAYPPGTGGEYSNIAYALAGYLVEAISGVSFEQYCQDSIFAPLGMDETSWFLANLDVDNVAVPTDYLSSGFFPYGHFGFPVYPAGQLRTSSSQLARYLIAFMQKGTLGATEVLDGATVDSMTTVQYPGVPVLPGVEWGLGWYRFDPGTGWMWCHEGGIFGVSTGMYYDPAKDYGIIFLTNGNGNDGHGVIWWNMYAYAQSLGNQTPVQLVSFTAAREGESARLAWRVSDSFDHRGFHVWRERRDQRRIRINGEPITGRDVYEYVDDRAPDEGAVYWLQEIANDGSVTWLGSVKLEALASARDAILSQNYPNPFNPHTAVSFFLPATSRVTVSVYDSSGRLIKTLVDDVRTTGVHRCEWDGRNTAGDDVASGVYFYRLNAGKISKTKKMTLVR